MKLAPVFGDNAVFAEDKPIKLFGSGSGRVRAELCGVSREAVSEGDGWELCLPPLPAGGPYELFLDLNGEKTVLHGVYIGIVLLFAGQSNVEFMLESSNSPKSEYVSDPLLRMYFVERAWGAHNPFLSAQGWHTAQSGAVGKWSAIGYLTGKYLRGSTGRAVGVINCSVGASVMRSWLPADEAAIYDIPAERLHPDHFYTEFEAFNKPGEIYGKMLRTVAHYRLSGIVWYQGESNACAGEARLYPAALKRFFSVLRAAQDDETAKIALVQIADCDERLKWDGEGWLGVQRAQAEFAAADAHCTLVRSGDVCERDCIHPPTKSLLSKRIAEVFANG